MSDGRKTTPESGEPPKSPGSQHSDELGESWVDVGAAGTSYTPPGEAASLSSQGSGASTSATPGTSLSEEGLRSLLCDAAREAGAASPPGSAQSSQQDPPQSPLYTLPKVVELQHMKADQLREQEKKPKTILEKYRQHIREQAARDNEGLPLVADPHFVTQARSQHTLAGKASQSGILRRSSLLSLASEGAQGSADGGETREAREAAQAGEGTDSDDEDDRARDSEFLNDWSSRPDNIPPKNWAFRPPKRDLLSIRYARVGETSVFSKKGLATLFLTNLLSLLIGTGVGLWISKHGFFVTAVKVR